MKHLIFLPLVMLMSIGCGASGVRYQASALQATRTMNDEAVLVIEQQCAFKSAEAARNPDVTTDQAEVDSSAILETCEEISAAQHLVAESHTTWGKALLKQISDDEFEMEALLTLAVQLVVLYGEVQVVADQIGIELPAVPDVLQGLIGAVQ